MNQFLFAHEGEVVQPTIAAETVEQKPVKQGLQQYLFRIYLFKYLS